MAIQAPRSRPFRSRRPRRRHRLFLEPLETRLAPATVSWISATGGDWDTASNWSGGAVPGATDDVVINQSGITVTHATGTIDSINSSAARLAFPSRTARCR